MRLSRVETSIHKAITVLACLEHFKLHGLPDRHLICITLIAGQLVTFNA